MEGHEGQGQKEEGQPAGRERGWMGEVLEGSAKQDMDRRDERLDERWVGWWGYGDGGRRYEGEGLEGGGRMEMR